MPVSSSTERVTTEPSRRDRHRQLAEQLRKWSLEDPEYDERVGELLEKELTEDHIRFRSENIDDPAA